jgi:DsbC/DsbD-like thiol-disulfide interchange protein
MNATRTRPVTYAMAGVTLILSAIFPPASARAAPPTNLVQASLIADVKTAAPGQTFHIGLLLKLKPQWHVYWENPGDSGSTTRLKITAPAGVILGPVQYPLPETFNQPGDIVGYGYEGEVMLVAPITLPADWPANSPIQLHADASWLVCNDVCIPGKAKLDLRVPVAKESQPDNTVEFQTWTARLPAVAHLPFKIEGTAESFKLNWSAPVQDVHVLTVTPEGTEVARTDAKHDSGVTVVTNKLRILEPEKAPTASLGVLVTYQAASGQKQGARFDIPFRSK